MEILNFILQVVAGTVSVVVILGICIFPVMILGWLFGLPNRGFTERRTVQVRVIKKTPVEDTDAAYRNIDLASGSFASQWGGHPLELVVDLNGVETPCNCHAEFYEHVHIDDTITVVTFFNPKTNKTKKFCFVP